MSKIKRRVGRPPGPKNKLCSSRITLLVTPLEKREWRRAAKGGGRTLSTHLRLILNRHNAHKVG